MYVYRLLKYYYCREGFVAFLPQFDTPESMSNIDFTQVTNLTELANQTEALKVQLICVPAPTPSTEPRKSRHIYIILSY